MVPLTYISLFTGVAGLDLGLHLAADARCVLYVEREIYAAAVLAKRIKEGALDDAPIFSDVSAINFEDWRGVDGIIGGFPCQDLSVAGKRAGIQEGNRSGLWFEFARAIREARPRFVFVENVPGLLTNANMGRVLGDLSAMGFDAEWGVFSASEVGASHRRERVFILAYSAESRPSPIQAGQSHEESRSDLPVAPGGRLADSQRSERRPEARPEIRSDERSDTERQGASRTGERGGILEHAERSRRTPAGGRRQEHAGTEPEPGGRAVADASEPGLQGRQLNPARNGNRGGAGNIWISSRTSLRTSSNLSTGTKP